MEFSTKEEQSTIREISHYLTHIISETNGITLINTLELFKYSRYSRMTPKVRDLVDEFLTMLRKFHQNELNINKLLEHPVHKALFDFFKKFPLPYHEEHIHLTGSLDASFIYPKLKKLLEGESSKIYKDKIKEVYGEGALPINSAEDVNKLIRLKEGEQFKTYLRILYLAKLVLTSRQAHEDAAYHMAKELYTKYNVGKIRLKFTLSRSTGISSEQVPGQTDITEEDVVLGLYDGFMKYKSENSKFDFVLSPSFRKESDFFDNINFETKKDHFDQQVKSLLDMLEKYPFLRTHLKEVDTVGDEKDLYRKKHFKQMKLGLRKLQYNGFKIRSHHGETWKFLRTGVQSVDNAMNIWHIDTLEHGLSLGVNPNYYFHRLFQEVMEVNQKALPFDQKSHFWPELRDMGWDDEKILDKIKNGVPLDEDEQVEFLKVKFHTAREIEHYQHDVLNRMINKNVSLVALPSSNLKLTGAFPDIKDHPFSWWEKKGVKLGVGTDNYITLNTNFIQEMLILLYSDPDSLKITKLLMITTREKRRPYISYLLWQMRKFTPTKYID